MGEGFLKQRKRVSGGEFLWTRGAASLLETSKLLHETTVNMVGTPSHGGGGAGGGVSVSAHTEGCPVSAESCAMTSTWLASPRSKTKAGSCPQEMTQRSYGGGTSPTNSLA